MDLIVPDAIVFIAGFLILLLIFSTGRKAWSATKSWLGPLLCLLVLYCVFRFTPVGDFLVQTWQMNT